jgi:hypothetical protein
MVQNGGAVWLMLKADKELDNAEQGGRSGKDGIMGADPGGKKRKCCSAGMESSFRRLRI